MKKILIHSYKGGTGKSLISVNLSNLLSQNGFKVLLIEFDLYGAELVHDRQLSKMFSESLNDYGYILDYLQDTDNEIEKYINKNHEVCDFDIIFSKPVVNLNEILVENSISILRIDDWYLSSVQKLQAGLSKIDEQYDFVLFDCGPGIHKIAVSLAYISSSVIVITRGSVASIEGSKAFISKFYRSSMLGMDIIMENKNLYVIVNNIPEHKILIDANLETFEEHLKFQIDGLNYPSLKITQFFKLHIDLESLAYSSVKTILLPRSTRFLKELNDVLELL